MSISPPFQLAQSIEFLISNHLIQNGIRLDNTCYLEIEFLTFIISSTKLQKYAQQTV